MFLRIPWELLWQFGIIFCCVGPFSCLSSLHCSGSCAFHGRPVHLSVGSFVLSRKTGVSCDWWLVYMVTGKNLLAVHFFFSCQRPNHSCTRTSLLENSFELLPLEFFMIFFNCQIRTHLKKNLLIWFRSWGERQWLKARVIFFFSFPY